MRNRQLLLLSSSKLHGFEYLEHAKDEIKTFLDKNNVKKILFIPYALPDYDNYLNTVSKRLNEWNYEVEGIHQHQKSSAIEAVKTAEAIFIGGGNTFVLLKTLYEKNLIDPIRKQVLEGKAVYIGSSAGTNVATRSIHTTNDMPVVYPPSFNALQLIPFNINPHYMDPEPDSKHKGETREERILNFLEYNPNATVVGLREGTSLLVDGDRMRLVGRFNARLFQGKSEPKEIQSGSDLSFLLGAP